MSRPTPVTDAKIASVQLAHAAANMDDLEHYMGMTGSLADHARQLERDRAECVETLEHYAACSDGCTCGDGWDHEQARETLARIREAK